jgi:hypothetical protein
MPERERLPNRRAAELIDFEHDRGRWTVTIGRYPDGRIAEIFLDAAKESPLSSWRKSPRSSPVSHCRAVARSTRCGMPFPGEAPGRWAQRSA